MDLYGLSVATVGHGPVFVCLFVELFYGASSSSSPILGFRAHEEFKLFMVLHTRLSPCFLQFVGFSVQRCSVKRFSYSRAILNCGDADR
jgi:hypothetical protein